MSSSVKDAFDRPHDVVWGRVRYLVRAPADHDIWVKFHQHMDMVTGVHERQFSVRDRCVNKITLMVAQLKI
jgi:hypothetical protein